MSEEPIFLNGPGRVDDGKMWRQKNRNIRTGFWILIMAVFMAGAWKTYDLFWKRHEYLITAYCNCPICINVPAFRDGKFASRRPVYWGGVAADRSVPLGSSLELVPVTPRDWYATYHFLGGKREFTVEDRGGKIRGRHIDIFFPDSRGGHKAATHWGVRRMRVKINGQLMD
ncbi:MAG: 3D domain-containing protein [Candidatus Omnitrophota bacterium]